MNIFAFRHQGCVEFLKSDIGNLKEREQRCFLKRESVKLIDKRNKVEMNIEILLFTDVIVFARKRSSTKKLVVVKQLHYLDRVQFIRYVGYSHLVGLGSIYSRTSFFLMS